MALQDTTAQRRLNAGKTEKQDGYSTEGRRPRWKLIQQRAFQDPIIVHVAIAVLVHFY